MSLTVYTADLLINHILRGQWAVLPQKWYVGLLVGMPNVEASGLGYKRLPIELTPAQNGETTNKYVLRTPQAGSRWGEIVGGGLYDAESGGHLWVSSALPKPVIIDMTHAAEFPSGKFKFRFVVERT